MLGNSHCAYTVSLTRDSSEVQYRCHFIPTVCQGITELQMKYCTSWMITFLCLWGFSLSFFLTQPSFSHTEQLSEDLLKQMVNVNNILDLMPLHKLILLSPADNTKPLVVFYFFMFSYQFNKQWSQQWLNNNYEKRKNKGLNKKNLLHATKHNRLATATVKNKTKNSLSANHTLSQHVTQIKPLWHTLCFGVTIIDNIHNLDCCKRKNIDVGNNQWGCMNSPQSWML